MKTKERLFQAEKLNLEALCDLLNRLSIEVESHDQTAVGRILQIEIRDADPYSGEIPVILDNMDGTLSQMESQWAENWREALKVSSMDAQVAKEELEKYILRKPKWYQRVKNALTEQPDPPILHH
jgi:hypothetical protein